MKIIKIALTAGTLIISAVGFAQNAKKIPPPPPVPSPPLIAEVTDAPPPPPRLDVVKFAPPKILKDQEKPAPLTTKLPQPPPPPTKD